jgi:hypothetical protein
MNSVEAVLAKSVTLTGAPALLVILVVVALLVTGAVVAIRWTGRGLRRGTERMSAHDKRGRRKR